MELGDYGTLFFLLLVISTAAVVFEPVIDWLGIGAGNWGGRIVRWLLILLGLLFRGMVALFRLCLPSETTVRTWVLWWEYKRRMRSVNCSLLTEAEKRGALSDLHRWFREEMKKLLLR